MTLSPKRIAMCHRAQSSVAAWAVFCQYTNPIPNPSSATLSLHDFIPTWNLTTGSVITVTPATFSYTGKNSLPFIRKMLPFVSRILATWYKPNICSLLVIFFLKWRKDVLNSSNNIFKDCVTWYKLLLLDLSIQMSCSKKSMLIAKNCACNMIILVGSNTFLFTNIVFFIPVTIARI